PRRAVSPEVQHQLLERFLAALPRDDADALLSLFAETVTFTSNGGGKVRAARKVLEGRARVIRFLLSVHRKWGADHRYTPARIDGHPALLTHSLHGPIHSVTALATAGAHITALYRIMNPDTPPGLPPPPPAPRAPTHTR